MTENKTTCSHIFSELGDCTLCGFFPDRVDPEIDPTVKLEGSDFLAVDPSTGKYFERIHISANFIFKAATEPSLEDDSYECISAPSIHIQAGEDFYMVGQWLEKERVFKFSPAHRTLQAAAAEALELAEELLPGH
jgi:hypothetical protein